MTEKSGGKEMRALASLERGPSEGFSELPGTEKISASGVYVQMGGRAWGGCEGRGGWCYYKRGGGGRNVGGSELREIATRNRVTKW